MEEGLVYLTSLLFGLGTSAGDASRKNAASYCVFLNWTEESGQPIFCRPVKAMAWVVTTPHKLGLDINSVLYQLPVAVLIGIAGSEPMEGQLPAFADCLGIQWHSDDRNGDVYICFEGCQRVLNTGTQEGEQTALYLAQKAVGPAEGLLWDYLESPKEGT